MTRRCIIGSSNGGAFRAASDCIQAAGYEIAWTVITDRKCGLLDFAEERGYGFHQVCYTDPDQFSTEAMSLVDRSGCEDVLLFYTRRLASPLIDLKRVWNIHPALLPAFQGFMACVMPSRLVSGLSAPRCTGLTRASIRVR